MIYNGQISNVTNDERQNLLINNDTPCSSHSQQCCVPSSKSSSTTSPTSSTRKTNSNQDVASYYTDDNNKITIINTEVRNENNTNTIEHDLNNNINNIFTFQSEIIMIIRLGIPLFIIQLGAVTPSFIIASYISLQFGSTYLNSFTLANMTANLCILTLIEGIYSSLNTLLPQSYGAKNYKELQNIIIRGYILCLIIFIPISIVLCFQLTNILQYINEDYIASIYATQYFRLYIISFPIHFIYQIISIFLSSQHIMLPQTLISLFSTLTLLPIFLYILEYYIGFQGTAISIILFEICQLILLILYLSYKKPYHPETWTGMKSLLLSFKGNVMSYNRFHSFFILSLGGMLASAYWIYWEVSCLIVGTLGITALSVHTIVGQVLEVIFTIPCGFGIALSIRIGNILPVSSNNAKKLCYWGFGIGTISCSVLSCSLYIFRKSIYSIFTTEIDIINGCEEIWFKVTIYCFGLNMYAILLGIFTGLGKQGTLGIVCVIFLWIISLPMTYYCAVALGGGLNAAWDNMYLVYIGINITLCASLLWIDWEDIAHEIRSREGLLDNEKNSLMTTSSSKDISVPIISYNSIES